MNWFYDTFLPSLLERAGTNKGMWLSRKQTAICIEKMEKHTTMVAQFQGDYYRHNYHPSDSDSARSAKISSNASCKSAIFAR